MGAYKIPVKREKDNKIVGSLEPFVDMKAYVLYDVSDNPFAVITDLKTTLNEACLMVEKHYEETHGE